MALIWLIVLVIYGLGSQWNIHPEAWLLLIPLLTKDLFDRRKP